MTKSQIKAELRRSACEDKDPAFTVDDDAYFMASEFKDDSNDPYLIDIRTDVCRTFFLLVAEAL